MKTRKTSLKSYSPLPTELSPLTEKEKSVLEYIEISVARSGISPSYQEIKDHFGFASFNSVQNYLKQLSHKGYVKIPSHQKRAIQILHPAQTVQKIMQEKQAALGPLDSEHVLSLPLLGRVAAGRPIESFTHDEFIEAPPSLVRLPSKTFALEVSGDSMIEEGIFDKDIILVQKQVTASNGDVVVASIDNESTVKKYFFQTPQVELRPANSALKSMWYSPEQVQIQGLVVGLMRKL